VRNDLPAIARPGSAIIGNGLRTTVSVAGVDVETTPNAVLRGLVNDGPVRVAPTDEQDLAVFGSFIEHFTLHDALLVANHRVRGTEAMVTNDSEFSTESTIWE